jgi:hypothetical protein
MYFCGFAVLVSALSVCFLNISSSFPGFIGAGELDCIESIVKHICALEFVMEKGKTVFPRRRTKTKNFSVCLVHLNLTGMST